MSAKTGVYKIFHQGGNHIYSIHLDGKKTGGLLIVLGSCVGQYMSEAGMKLAAMVSIFFINTVVLVF